VLARRTKPAIMPHSHGGISGMKITKIRATPVNIPLEAPYLWSHGTLPGFSKAIVEVETSDGIVGFGEAPSAGMARSIEDELGPRLIGRDPIDIAGCEQRCLPSWRGVTSTTDIALIRAFGAIELALWDIRGKAWNRPLYQLLGGAVRTEVAFTDYFAYRTRLGSKGGEGSPEAVVDYCLGLKAEHGTTMFEGKFSNADPRGSVRMIERLRRAMPDAMLRIDSNQAYSLATAREIARAIEPLGVRNWEDPVASFEEMAALRRHTAIPFSTHNIDLRRAVALSAPDAIVTDTCVHGGLGRTIRFIGACEAMGVDFWCYSGDSGVMSAAYLHVAASMPWIREPSQSLFRMQPFDVIEEGPFRPRNNVVRVPEGPGLGVTLSRDKLEFCHRHFREHGPMNKYHDPDAPGVYRRLPLS